MNETTFQQKLRRWLENNIEFCSLNKIHQGQFGSGVSDLVGSINGRYFAIECKVITLPKRSNTPLALFKSVTPQQRHFLDVKLGAMADCYIAIWIEPIKQCLLVNWENYIMLDSMTTGGFMTWLERSNKFVPQRWHDFGVAHLIKL